MPNGDEQKLAILREMGSIVDKLDSSISKYEKRLSALELTHVEKDAFNNMMNELRQYTDDKMEAGISRGENALDDKIGLARAGLMSEIERLITDRFDEWEKKSLVPLFEQLTEEREERKQAERDRQVQQWRNRIALGTAILLFLVSMYQTLRPKPDMTRDYVRPIERLSDITQ